MFAPIHTYIYIFTDKSRRNKNRRNRVCGLKRIEKRKRGGGNGTLDMGFIAAHLAQQRAWKSCFSSLGPPDSPKYAHDYGVPDYQFVIPCLLFKYRTVSPSPDAEIPRRCVEFVISLPPFSLSFFSFSTNACQATVVATTAVVVVRSICVARFFIFYFLRRIESSPESLED